jgi:hypothetical protein
MEAFQNQLRYSSALKPKGASHRLIRASFQPLSSGTFTTSNRIITIPISSPSFFLDTNRSYLRLTGSFTAANQTVYLRSAYSMIDRVRVLSSSGAVLSDTQQYGYLANRFLDHLLPASVRGGQGADAGFGNSQVATVDSTSVGALFASQWVQATAGNTTSFQFCVPIILDPVMTMSSGTNEDKQGVWMPLPLMNEIRLEVTLRSSLEDIFDIVTAGGSVSSFSLSATYEAQLIDLGPEIPRQLQQSVMQAGGKLFLSLSQYMTQTMSSATTTKNYQIAARAKSVRGIWWSDQLVSAVNSYGNQYDTGIFDNHRDIYLLINGRQYPENRIGTAPVASENAREVREQLSYFYGKSMVGPLASQPCFTSSAVATTVGGTPVGSFACGIDLEGNAQSFLENGYDLSTGNANITINYTTANATAVNTIIAVHMDCILVVDVMTKECMMTY